MNRLLPAALGNLLLAFGLAACAAPMPHASPQSAGTEPAPPAAGACNADSLSWAIGQVADDALVERARTEAGAQSVRMLRPGIMITREFNAARLNVRVDNERKVISTSCG